MKKSKPRFAVFIISHGRPEVPTMNSLFKEGHYTGDWYIVIDNEDSEANRAAYLKNYPGHIIEFNKTAYIASKQTDTMYNQPYHKAAVFVTNWLCGPNGKVAQMGYDYFLLLSDDMRHFYYLIPVVGKDGILRVPRNFKVFNFDWLFARIIDFMEITPALTLICFNEEWAAVKYGLGYIKTHLRKVLRIVTTLYFIRTADPIAFTGNIYEDIITSALLNSVGRFCFRLPFIFQGTELTGGTDGGMSSTYRTLGTYAAEFLKVVAFPSTFKIEIKYDYSLGIMRPKAMYNSIYFGVQIISSRYKKCPAA